ncbi:MAG: lamin tail domain-containing protein [Phycisphaerae bacterium]|nr:lamin tail domain-containing protein [Phycisphaerae bacterium]
MSSGNRSTSQGLAVLEALEPRLLLSGSVVISEFMASNDTTRLDGDGEYSDWIELHNPTLAPVGLGGWFLTDNAGDLTKWEFPDITLAANGDSGGEDYLIIFASNENDADWPYYDAGGYLHTNFKLSANDADQHESVLLVRDDGLTVEHGYEDYPEQVGDVSYGIGDAAPVYDELVSVGAAVSYLVPTAEDEDLLPDPAPLGDPGWTAATFDDSTWTNTISRDQAGMIITEIDSGAVNFVEIQNVSDAVIDTTGWSVLVNDASGTINSVNSLEWEFGSEVAVGEVLYRSDDFDSDPTHYWGSDIDWAPGGDGWAMIVDNADNVVDFVAWGYSEADIALLNFIDVTGQWNGAGTVVGDGTGGGVPGSEENFINFGDSWYYMHPLDGVDPADPAGPNDTDFNTTWMQPVGYDGPAFSDDPRPAMLGFGTIDYLEGAPFGTDIGTPDSGDRYTAYFRRELILGTDVVNAGIQILCDDGAIIYIDGEEVARANINGPDSYTAFAISSSGTETTLRELSLSDDLTAGTHWISVSVHQNQANSSDMGFDMRLFGQPTAAPGSALERTGNADSDTAADFQATDTPDMGNKNASLSVPFGTTAPAITGLGFSADQPLFDSLIQTDVGSDMHTENASLWARINFSVASTDSYDALTLRMKYNDGFVAYLNGSLVAWRNAPGTLAWNSSTGGVIRSDAQSVAFEDIDITAHLLGTLQPGANVLAIHVLNADKDNANLLMVPELIASGAFDVQYMTSSTPGGANSAGAYGLAADTEFSVDRGFYESPQLVAITSDTPGALIRYTLDGTKPTETYGTVYSTPLPITTTTTLRAIAYLAGYISSNVDTQTYIFPHAVVEQDGAGFPDDWGVVSGYSDYEIDSEVVGTNAAPNPDYYDDFIEGLTAIPTLSLVLPVSDMFANGGLYDNPGSTTMEKETSAELIYPDGTKGFQIDAGLKMQGGASRNEGNSPKHSMSLRFRQQYGPGHLDFPLYEGSSVESFNSLQLRAMYNNSWIHWDPGQRSRGSFIREQWARDTLLAMEQSDAGQGMYVHLYIDGLYWGVHVLQERQEASHYAAYNGGDEDTLDALNSGSAIDGSIASWSAMQSFVAGAAADGIDLAEFQQIQQKLDVVSFIDYMIVNQYGGNADWDGHNWRAAGGGPDNAPWKIYSWDAERILETGALTSNRIGLNNTNCPSRLFQGLRQSGEFNLMFADRVHKHFYNDGALTPDAAAGLWMELADQLDQAIVAESARWGDYRRDVHVRGSAGLYTRNDYWYPEQQALMSSYFPLRGQEVLQDYESALLYPTLDAPVFNINGSYQHGGLIAAGAGLSMTGGLGTIYYTLDGTDPRLPGGGISPDAIEYTGPVTLDASAYVFSRVLNGDTWSALNEATYDVSTTPTVAITEINYHPHDPSALEEGAGFEDAEDFEFVEFRNTGAQAVNLRTVHFSDGIEFDFTRSSVTSLAPDAYALVVRNTAAFQARYPSVPAGIIAGEFTGALNSDGEDLALVHGASSAIHNFAYNDSGSWPGKADGKGATLTVVDTAGDYGDSDNWTPSVAYGGTPGAEPQLPLGIVINEVLTHTDIPDVDSIELHNTTGESIDIGGWFLSDTWGSSLNPLNGDYKKFQIPAGTTIPAGGYLVFDEGDFNPIVIGGGSLIQFALDGAHGDNVWLMQADGLGNLTHFADHVEFGGARNGESFGRWPDGTGGLYPMILQTLGDDNSSDVNNGPRAPDPLIISELHYNSSEPDSSDDLEFVEIHNHSDEEVDLTGWRIRGEVDYDFYPDTIIAAGGTLVVLSFNPDNPDNAARVADFRAAHGIDGSVALAGGYGGKLDNGGGRVVLQSPDEPPIEEPEYIPHLVEDEANYDDEAPWPASPDGLGDSLNRSDPHFWGNDSASWHAAAPTPGFYERLNKFPYFTSAPLAVATEGVPFSYEVTADDPDIDDWLTITAATPLPGWLTLVDHGTGDGTATLSGTPPSGSVVVDLLVTDGLDATDDQAFSITVYDASEPAVVQVFVSSSEWSPLFLDDLDSENLLHQPIPQLGYRITDEVAPLDALPWGNLDTLVICFSRDVATELDNLTLSGVSEPLYTTGEADYTLSTFTAAWTLPDPIGTDKLLIDLPGAAVGDFQLRFDALPGDTTRDGATNLVDRDGIRDRMFVWADQGGYSGFYDLNGSGRIDFLDWSVVLANRGASLPPGAPTAPAGAAGQSAALAAGASGEIFMVNASVAPPSGVPAPLTASIPAPLATDAPADPIRFASYAPASEPAIDLTSAADYLPSPTFRQVEAIASGVDDPPSQILLQTGFDESTAPVSLDPDLDAPLVDILAEAEFEAFSLL